MEQSLQIENIPPADAQADTNLSNANMEVHHHPRAEKKSIKEYLLEGLMIFIAVTLGFFAESLRESITNHEKAKTYMVGLVNDLKLDTAYLSININGIKKLQTGVEKLIEVLNKPLTDAENARQCIAYYYKYGDIGIYTPYAEGTISQLKNNGGLSLITNTEIVKEINNYEATKALDAKVDDIFLHDLGEINNNKITLLFNFYATQQLSYIAATDAKFASRDISEIEHLIDSTKRLMLSNPSALAVEISNRYYKCMGMLTSYAVLLGTSKKHAEKLIALVKEEYGLEQ